MSIVYVTVKELAESYVRFTCVGCGDDTSFSNGSAISNNLKIMGNYTYECNSCDDPITFIRIDVTTFKELLESCG